MGWQGSDRNAARTNTMSRFETETLTQEDNLKGLALMNPQWVELAMAHTPHRRVILDMDSSESPVHGQQEGVTGVALGLGCRCHEVLPLSCRKAGSSRPIRCGPPPFFPGSFAGGAGGTVALSRAAISSLVSFSLGLARPSSEFLLVMFPLVPGSPGLARVTAVT